VKRLVLVLSFAVVWPGVATWAQVLVPNEVGVSMGQWHTIVRNVEATKKFWVLVGLSVRRER
jgi:hypothetical protein